MALLPTWLTPEVLVGLRKCVHQLRKFPPEVQEKMVEFLLVRIPVEPLEGDERKDH